MRPQTKCRCVHGLPWFDLCHQCLLDRYGDNRTIERSLSWDGATPITVERIEIEYLKAERDMWRHVAEAGWPPGRYAAIVRE